MPLQSTVPSSKANSAPTSPLPVIICLHGGGTNSTIFNIQTIRLQRALASYFDFVFLDAPFTSPAGPGVLPFFEGCGPFYRWGNHGSPDLSDEARRKIRDRIEEVENGKGDFDTKGKREVVGVLGFSQGGRCAAGLVLEQQLGVESPLNSFKGFKFGVFLNSTSPPLVSASLTDTERKEKVRLPGVHIIGTEDPWRDEGFKLWKDHFEEESSVIEELECGHRLPIKEEDTQKIVKEVLKAWNKVRGEGEKAVAP